MSNTVVFKDHGMQDLIDAMSGELPKAKVGILGDNTNREETLSNADVGIKHEFGTETLPIRSFLRVPLTDNMQKYLNKSGAFDEEALKKVIEENSLFPWLKKIAIIGETIVIDGFDSGGFGKWPPSDMTKIKVHQTLVETQQLRDSITSEVPGD